MQGLAINPKRKKVYLFAIAVILASLLCFELVLHFTTVPLDGGWIA